MSRQKLVLEQLEKDKLKLSKDVMYTETPNGPVYIEKKVMFGKPQEAPEVSKLRQNVLLASSATASFCVPFLIGTPQILVGTVVNAMLLSASGLGWKKLMPFIILPSIATLSRGLVFGPFTPFMLAMVPMIWAGNALLVYTFRACRTMKRFGLPFGVATAASIKSAFLATTSMLLSSVGLFPAVLLPSMSSLQLTTALLGGGLAAGLISAWEGRKFLAAKKKTKFFFMHVEQRE